MTVANKKIINSYLKEIYANLNCKKSLKAVFIKELKSDIENYADSVGLSIKDDLYREFGTPEEIANSLFDRHDYDVLLKKAKGKALAWKLIAIISCILFIVAICCFADLLAHVRGEVTVTNIY